MLFTTRSHHPATPASILGSHRRQQELALAQQALIDALAAADHSQAVSALAEVRLALRAVHHDARQTRAAVSDHEWQLLCESEQAVETLGKTLLEGAACNSEYDHPQRAA
ncbi:hypothetical protein [Algiphilus sp.]|uniref:hypothetical protein n=1 Tax=Algiphilus sp. TaxID=1872431 RepID=UPI003B529B31